MLLIIGGALPSLASHTLDQWGKALEHKISPRLSPAQRSHIRRFAKDALPCRLSSLLIRCLLLQHIPPGQNLDMHKNGACLIAGSCISISHGRGAAFAALYPHRNKKSCQLGLDVEFSMPLQSQNAFFSCLQKIIPAANANPLDKSPLRQWTLYEALYKLENDIIPRLRHDPQFQKIFWHLKNRGSFQLAGQTYFYRFFRWQNHLLSIAAQKNIFSSIKFVWHGHSYPLSHV